MSWRVRVQADDFFNSYLVLKENDSLMMGKLEKLRGKPLVGTKEFGTRPTLGATIVCLAFAVELYFKEIYYALGIQNKRPKGRNGHNILKLYEGLPENIRKDIFAHEAISKNPFTTRGDIFSIRRYESDYTVYDGFINQLKAISNGFQKWRYSYESAALHYEEWFALALIEAVKSSADAIRTMDRAYG